MAHRGPDGADAVAAVGGGVVLGHRRLEVTSSRDDGRQPIASEDGRLMLVANAEVYNQLELRGELLARGHRFRTSSDVEVILHGYEEWGRDLEQRLEGDWAFGLWDGRRGEIVLSRDRFGVKPLYYTLLDGGLAFASEVRALLAAGFAQSRLDRAGIAGVLAWQSVPAPLTLIEGVRALESASRLTFSIGREKRSAASPGDHRARPDGEGGARIEHYQDPLGWGELGGDRSPNGAWPGDQVGDQIALRESLSRAIGARLPERGRGGLLCSGGLDSSLIAAIALLDHEHELKLFSLGFERADKELDETREVARLASGLGLSHEVVVADDARVATRFEDFLDALDQPSGDAFNSYLACEVASGEVRALLSGAGADELFLGYPHLAGLPSARPPKLLVRPLMGPAWEQIGLDPLAMRLRRRVRPLGHRRLFSDREIAALLGDPVDTGSGPDRASEVDGGDSDSLRAARDHDLRHYLPETLLRDLDSASMAYGVEARVPYLDAELAQAVLSIPARQRALPGDLKAMLRRVGEPYLNAERLAVPKRGFELPFRRWLLGPLRGHVDRLAAGGVEPPLDRGRASLLARRFRRHLLEPRKLFAVLVVEGWASRHGANAVSWH